jgi:signal peptidase I
LIEKTNNDDSPKKEFVKATRSQKKGSKEILRLGQKVYDYRKDILSEEDARNLESANAGLKKALSEKPLSGPHLEEKAKEVDIQLQKSGDFYYHKKSWVENVEMLLVAAIVVIGIRSFFVQPFIIPTNSMYPSFSGMQPHVYEDKDSTPGFVGRCVDKLFLGASHFSLEAESAGNLYLKLQGQMSFRFDDSKFPEGRFFIFPSTVREYVFEVGGKDHVLRVPAEFDLDELIAKRFAGVENLQDLPLIVTQDQGFPSNRLKLSDKHFNKGDLLLGFDILLGDALFVDRFSYNFVHPKSGDPAVFRTGSIDEFNRKIGTGVVSQIGEDKYYIKRLVGEPGDVLQMKVPESIFTNGTDVRKGVPGVVYRNGVPLDGRTAFDRNRKRVEDLASDPNAVPEDAYPGYRAEGILTNQASIKVPKAHENPTGKKAFFAMGDNSTDSLDGRAWGFVPENEIIGRAFLVYYPFTKRWGFAD